MRAVNFTLNGNNTVNRANDRPTMTKDYLQGYTRLVQAGHWHIAAPCFLPEEISE